MDYREKNAHFKGMLEFVPGLSNESRKLFESLSGILSSFGDELEERDMMIELLEDRIGVLEEQIEELEEKMDELCEEDDGKCLCGQDCTCLEDEDDIEEESRFRLVVCGKCGLSFPYDPEALEDEDVLQCPGCGGTVDKGKA